jgi:tRNA/tmRNA/rRNA uracil-C5-methylase (TrmA/RlmC/RlmD family)
VAPTQGSIIELDIEKPVAGGRMLARHGRQVALVRGAIPGERVRARVERSAKGVIYADTVGLIDASPHRRSDADTRCGGNVFAHIAYARQPALKAEILQDAVARIGRFRLAQAPAVVESPERGYRMRARLHASEGRLGFFREGTHHLCDAGQTGQLLPGTIAWLDQVQDTLHQRHLQGLAGLELAENVTGDERACHLVLQAGADPRAFLPLAGGLTGLSAGEGDSPGASVIAGTPSITDVLRTHGEQSAVRTGLTLRRSARAFFQGNRFLLERLVEHVLSLLPDGPALDLYAGVGLFGLALAADRGSIVTLVEGDPISGGDLEMNAAPFGDYVRVERRSVEAFLADSTVPRRGPGV